MGKKCFLVTQQKIHIANLKESTQNGEETETTTRIVLLLISPMANSEQKNKANLPFLSTYYVIDATGDKLVTFIPHSHPQTHLDTFIYREKEKANEIQSAK